MLHAAVRRLHSEVAPPSTRPVSRSSQLSLLRSEWCGPFPAGTDFPPRLPKDVLEFRRIGFVLLNPPPQNPPNREQTERSDKPITEREPEDRWSTESEVYELEEESDIVLVLSDSSLSDTEETDSQQAPGLRRERQNISAVTSGKAASRWTR